MAKWKTTSLADKAKVIAAKVNDPWKSTRDIEKETWVNYSTASRVIKQDLQQVATKSEHIAKLIDDNNRILEITWWMLIDKLENWEKVRIDEIIKSRDLALKQNKLVEVTESWDSKEPIIISF